jgi:hypothetical protein
MTSAILAVLCVLLSVSRFSIFRDAGRLTVTPTGFSSSEGYKQRGWKLLSDTSDLKKRTMTCSSWPTNPFSVDYDFFSLFDLPQFGSVIFILLGEFLSVIQESPYA